MKRTHEQRVLAWLRKHGSITPMQALREIGTMRLGARIYDLRRAGVPITKSLVTVRTRDGSARVARYTLV